MLVVVSEGGPGSSAKCRLKFQGTVIVLEEKGVFVKITDHIRGLCPKLHLADINLKRPEKRFIPGKKIKCRVRNGL